MRRQEIIDGMNQIISAIDRSSILENLEEMVQPLGLIKEDVVSPKILNSLRLYNIYAHNFNDAAKQINHILGLSGLEVTDNWLNMAAPRGPLLYTFYRYLEFAKEQLPRIVELLTPKKVKHFEDSKILNSKYSEMRIFTVNVFEEDNVSSSPARLANVLESIDHFYTVCALLDGESPSTLSVIACDSGSDKSFDFLGIAKLMDCVERIIQTLFERVFFFREHQFEERLDLVTKALPIIQQINKLEEHKELAPEMAEVLRRNILDGANKFIQSGATISKIEDKSEFDARLLLSPVQKLLVASPDEPTEEVSSERSDKENTIIVNDNSPQENVTDSERPKLENLSDEEKDQLIRLLEKSRLKSLDRSATDTESKTDQAMTPEDLSKDTD